MFMTRRKHVPNVNELVADLHKAHEEHISKHSKTIMSAQVLDENGKMAGVIAISAHETWDDINHYVYQDPYTIAGAYAEIKIEEVGVYLLDAGYARAPEWFLEEHPELAPRFTPVERHGRR